MRRTTLAVAVAALVSALGLAGCGGSSDDDGAASPPGGTTSTTETEREMETETGHETTTTHEGTPGEGTATSHTIRIVVREGRVEGGIQRPSVQKGQNVVLVVDTDAGEYVHVHGYDLRQDVVAGRPTRLPFVADTPGRFEVELHNPSVVIADLQVQP